MESTNLSENLSGTLFLQISYTLIIKVAFVFSKFRQNSGKTAGFSHQAVLNSGVSKNKHPPWQKPPDCPKSKKPRNSLEFHSQEIIQHPGHFMLPQYLAIGYYKCYVPTLIMPDVRVTVAIHMLVLVTCA